MMIDSEQELVPFINKNEFPHFMVSNIPFYLLIDSKNREDRNSGLRAKRQWSTWSVSSRLLCDRNDFN